MNTVLILVAALAVFSVLWWRHRAGGNSRYIASMIAGRAAGTIRSKAQLIDGGNQILVALTLERNQITYQNLDLNGSIGISQIDEVEYGSDLVTGGIAHGAVLRLRSHGRAIEFIMPVAAAAQWSQRLPPHRMNEVGRVEAI
jgi:hypothetical protein